MARDKILVALWCDSFSLVVSREESLEQDPHLPHAFLR